jgi:hypothetical protein
MAGEDIASLSHVILSAEAETGEAVAAAEAAITKYVKVRGRLWGRGFNFFQSFSGMDDIR